MNKPRNYTIPIKVDKISDDKLKRFGDLSGIGHCGLAAIGCYIVLGALEQTEKEAHDNWGKTFDEIVNLYAKGEVFSWAYPGLRDTIFNKRYLPKQLVDQIMEIVLSHIKVEKLNKKDEDIEYLSKQRI